MTLRLKRPRQSALDELEGVTQGRLTVLKEVEPLRTPLQDVRRFLVRCSCGSPDRVVAGTSLTRKRGITSCGCLRVEKAIATNRQRGWKKAHQLYPIWQAMKRRCYNNRCLDYPNYGGRGITVCDKWHHFSGFVEDMNDHYLPGLTLDRIDVNQGYALENCRWATQTEQANNRRNTLYITYGDLCQPIKVWANQTGLSISVIYQRIKKLHWSVEKALTTPVK